MSNCRNLIHKLTILIVFLPNRNSKFANDMFEVVFREIAIFGIPIEQERSNVYEKNTNFRIS